MLTVDLAAPTGPVEFPPHALGGEASLFWSRFLLWAQLSLKRGLPMLPETGAVVDLLVPPDPALTRHDSIE